MPKLRFVLFAALLGVFASGCGYSEEGDIDPQNRPGTKAESKAAPTTVDTEASK